MKGYKVFNKDWTCQGFQYEVGKTYIYYDKLELCKSGFHFCKKLADCFNYYSFNPENKVAEIKAIGDIINEKNKQVTNKIEIVKELSWEEVLFLINTGIGNSGYSNSGYSNSGHWNSGNWNSGNWNSGYSNSGNWNSGYSNSGNWNSGDWNSGYGNSGNGNSGKSNSGNWNSGNWNSGKSNSGNWNSTNFETGYFNSKSSEYINVFNKPCKRNIWEKAKKPEFIYFDLCKWINSKDMTDEEKKDFPNHKVRDGYLKIFDYKKVWEKAYQKATSEDIALLKALPNFDAEVFYEITGIKLNKHKL